MTNINLFGGPGTGKSTTAASIFAAMKVQGYKVELIQEYAKDLTYGNDQVRLDDQLHVLGEQHHRLVRLVGSVDYVVHDSPFVMGLTYLRDVINYPAKQLHKFTIALFNSYDNINIFLRRDNEHHPYQEYGRSQSLIEAEEKDEEIYKFLITNNIPFTEVVISDTIVEDILAEIK